MKKYFTLNYKQSQGIVPEKQSQPLEEGIKTVSPPVQDALEPKQLIKTRVNKGKGNTFWLALIGVSPQSRLGEHLKSHGYRLFRSNFTKLITPENLSLLENEIVELENNFNLTVDRTGVEAINSYLQQQKETLIETSENAENVEDVLNSNLKAGDKKKLTDNFVRKQLEVLANMTDEAAKQEIVQRFLTVSKDFHKYSFLNYLLMMLQNPDVSRFVRGAKQWQGDKFKREVREGEKPMQIFAPDLSRYIYTSNVFQLIKVLRNTNQNISINSDEFFSILKQNNFNRYPYDGFLQSTIYKNKIKNIGELVSHLNNLVNDPKAKKYKRVYYTALSGQNVKFKIVDVYDISQTDATSEDSFNPGEVQWQHEHNIQDENIFKFVQAALGFSKVVDYNYNGKKQKGIEIKLEGETGEAGGWSRGSQIAINKMSQGLRQFSTVVHEIAHSLLHFGEDRRQITSQQAEIEAESTAFIVLNYFGYNEPQFAANYLALHKATSQDVLARYSKIEFAAKKIIHGIENFLGKQALSWYNKIKIADESDLALYVEDDILAYFDSFL